MSKRRRGFATPPRRRRGSTSKTPSTSLSSLGIDVDDPLGTRRIVQQSVREQMAQEAAPIHAWLDANLESVRGFSMPALLARVRRHVARVRDLPEVQVEAAVRQWAALRGVAIPQVSILPLPGVPEIPPPPAGPSLADSDLAEGIRSLLSIPTSIEIERPHGRTEIGLSGATVELTRGGARVGSSISWGGTMGLFTEVGGVRFAGTLSADRWTMAVTFPAGAPVPDASRLGEIFRQGEQGLRDIVGEVAGFSSLGEVSAIGDAISPHLEPVKPAIDAARGIAEAQGRRVSVGITAAGPRRSASGAEAGFQVNATLTLRF